MVERIKGDNVKVIREIAWHVIGAWEMGAMVRIFGRIFLPELS